jgi:hypothetical protein
LFSAAQQVLDIVDHDVGPRLIDLIGRWADVRISLQQSREAPLRSITSTHHVTMEHFAAINSQPANANCTANFNH